MDKSECFFRRNQKSTIDQNKLLYLEKVGYDNPQLNEQIMSIGNKMLDNECFTTPQHQNVVTALK